MCYWNDALVWKMADCFPELSESNLNMNQNKLGDQMIEHLFTELSITKYWDLLMSCRSNNDLLTTNKSQYFTQPRPIIVKQQRKYLITKNTYKLILKTRTQPPPPFKVLGGGGGWGGWHTSFSLATYSNNRNRQLIYYKLARVFRENDVQCSFMCSTVSESVASQSNVML